MGSKSRIAKHIVPIIQQYIGSNEIEVYCEPFCGGCNVIDKIQCNLRLASDINPYLIALFENKNLVGGLPADCTKAHYEEVKQSYISKDGRFPDWYIGAIGFFASYNGRFFEGGYAATYTDEKGAVVRNYYDEAKRNFKMQSPALDNVFFACTDYRELYGKLHNALIYCDPPYEGVQQYQNAAFNHAEFWAWCAAMAKDNIVIVSEQTAPEGIDCIWRMPVNRTLDNKQRKTSIEKLFLV